VLTARPDDLGLRVEGFGRVKPGDFGRPDPPATKLKIRFVSSPVLIRGTDGPSQKRSVWL